MTNHKIHSIINCTLKYIFIAFVFIIIGTPEQYSNGAYIFAAVPFAIAAGFLSFKVYNSHSSNKKVLLISSILTALFLAQLSVFEIFKNFHFSNPAIGFLFRFLFIVLLAIAVYIVICSTLEHAMKTKSIEKTKLKMIPLFEIYIITLPVAIVALIYLEGSYPSYAYPDIITVWNEITNSIWNAWHTVGFQLYVRLLSIDGRYQYIISIFQTISWIYICNYAVHVLYSILKSKKICTIYSVLAAIIFTPALYCGMMLKDTIYCMCMFLFMLGMFHAIHTNELSSKQIFILVISGVGTSIFRHAGWISILCALVMLLIYNSMQRKNVVRVIAVLCITMCAILVVNNVLSNKVLNAVKNPAYVKYSVPMYLIGAVSSSVDDISDEDIAVMEQIMPVQKWKDGYNSNKYWADTLSRNYGIVGDDVEKLNDNKLGAAIIKLNLKWLFKYPRIYITSAFDISTIIWEIGIPYDAYEWAPLEGGAMDFSSGDAGIKRTVGTSISRSFSNLSFQNPLLKSVYWRGGLWLFIIIFAVVILLCKNNYKYLIAVSTPLITTLLLFLSIPAQDPRYILFLIECGLFIAVFAFFAPKQNKSKRKEKQEDITLT